MTKIAVTYKNGEIFQHFGHTEDFKVYSIEDNCISDSGVINTNGQGHEALAVFLSSLGVTVLICGGIGSGAMEALSEQNIKVAAGVKGNCDAAVKDYLAGKLEYTSVPNCSHHHEHGHEKKDPPLSLENSFFKPVNTVH